MKKNQKKINIEEFKTIHLVKIYDQIIDKIRESLDEIPKKLLKRSKFKSLSYLGIAMFSFPLILMPIIHKLFSLSLFSFLIGLSIAILGIIFAWIGRSPKKEIQNFIKNKINLEKIYADVFESLDDDIKFMKIFDKPLPTIKEQGYYFNIPKKSRSIQVTPLAELEYKNKYPIAFQNSHWTWVDSRFARNSVNNEKWLGAFVVDVKANLTLKNFEFSINKHSINTASNLHKNVELEDSIFVKNFRPKANDENKMKQIFTPSITKKLIDHIQDIEVNDWFVSKKGNEIVIAFVPSRDNVFLLDFDVTSHDADFITKQIVNKIIEDCHFVYSLFLIIDQMMLL